MIAKAAQVLPAGAIRAKNEAANMGKYPI